MPQHDFTPESIDRLYEFDCHLWRYSPSLSRLLLRLLRGDAVDGESHFVLFVSVEYFMGPVAWKGDELRFGTPQEIMNLVGGNQAGYYHRQLNGTDLPSTLKLYLFGNTAKILCHGAHLFTRPIEDF